MNLCIRWGSIRPRNNVCGSVPAHLDVNHDEHRQHGACPISKGDPYRFSVAQSVQGPVAGSYPWAAEKYQALFSPSSQATGPCSLHVAEILQGLRAVSLCHGKASTKDPLNLKSTSPYSKCSALRIPLFQWVQGVLD